MRGREGSPRAPLAPRPAVPAPLPPRPRLEGTVRPAAPESRIERRRPPPAQRRAPGLGGWGDGGVERARFRIAPRAARGGRALAAPAPAACRGGGLHCLPARLLLSPGLASLTSLGRAGSAHVWESSVRLASLGGFGRVVYPAPHPASSARWSFRASQQGDGNN